MTAVIVFITSVTLDAIDGGAMGDIFRNAGWHGGSAFGAGFLIQSLLPLIEKIFRIATSMTLLDYSDANQPLLKRLVPATCW